MFYLDNNTYTQGYNKKYGLLANNGFKIYPRYFYFSDKYKLLDFKIYSVYKGDLFNYDFSASNGYNIGSKKKVEVCRYKKQNSIRLLIK